MPDAPTPGEAACLNCGEKLLGDYCWRCGQQAVDLHRPLRQIVRDFFDDVLDLDTRLLRSIRPLLLRPGVLTREYLAGRRAPYAPPLRLFLLATLLFVGLTAVLPARGKVEVTVVQDTSKAPPPEHGGTRILLPERFPGGDSALAQRMNRANEKAKANPEEYMRAVVANMPRVFFLLLPIFALLVKLFYWRRDRFYMDHLIFALHFHAFAFVVLTLNSVFIRLWDPLSGPLRILLWSWFLTYLALALRRIYGGSWALTVVKLLCLIVIYFIVFAFGMLALLPVTLYFF